VYSTSRNMDRSVFRIGGGDEGREPPFQWNLLQISSGRAEQPFSFSSFLPFFFCFAPPPSYSLSSQEVRSRDVWRKNVRRIFGDVYKDVPLPSGGSRGGWGMLKCTKFDFGWGFAPDPTGGAYSAPPDPIAGFKWAYF